MPSFPAINIIWFVVLCPHSRQCKGVPQYSFHRFLLNGQNILAIVVKKLTVQRFFNLITTEGSQLLAVTKKT